MGLEIVSLVKFLGHMFLVSVVQPYRDWYVKLRYLKGLNYCQGDNCFFISESGTNVTANKFADLQD